VHELTSSPGAGLGFVESLGTAESPPSHMVSLSGFGNPENGLQNVVSPNFFAMPAMQSHMFQGPAQGAQFLHSFPLPQCTNMPLQVTPHAQCGMLSACVLSLPRVALLPARAHR
jgi:hypothetical protein